MEETELTKEEEAIYEQVLQIANEGKKQIAPPTIVGKRGEVFLSSHMCAHAKKILIEMLNGNTLSSTLKKHSLNWSDIVLFSAMNPQYKRAIEYCKDRYREILVYKAESVLAESLDNIDKEKEISNNSAKIAMFTLERLAKQSYSRESKADSTGQSNGGIVYNIQINQLASQKSPTIVE